MYSTDYDGVSDPAGFTWTPLFVDETPGGQNEARGPIDISSIGQSSSAYLAFRYVSAGPGGGNSPRYRYVVIAEYADARDGFCLARPQILKQLLVQQVG